MFKMLIGSDLVPTKNNYDLFESADTEALIGKRLIDELEGADFRIFNLETPVYDGQAPITKCGPNLIVPTRTMPGIKALNPSLMALANNHILDHGEDGLYSTFAELEKWNIPYIGAGHNLSEAQKPYIIEADGKKIGIYNCAEHEFTIAEENKGGANPFDPLESLDHIAELKEKCDFVIVLYHGGKEHYRYPTPRLKKVCRKIVQKGADLVVCQHSHCVGCMEEYNGSTIVYGQGNFIFCSSDSEFWQTSLLINAEFDETMHISFVPICKKDNTIRYADEKEAKEIMQGFEERSREILIPGKTEEKLKEVCEVFKRWYLYCIFGGNTVFGKNSAEYTVPQLTLNEVMLIRNYLECEPHLELLSTIIKDMAKEKMGDM